jgi:chemotaxis protein methyltransferase CheR
MPGDWIQSSNIDDPPASTALSPKVFDRLATYITSELGIKMPASKMPLVQSRLLRRVRELHLSSIDAYSEYFFSSTNTEERERFINAITTNKTDFFREAEHFDFLVRKVLPALCGTDARTARMRVWSAACSSGEEPYTLAMLLADYASKNQGMSYAILGTDISTKVLEHARKAVYRQSDITPIPMEYRKKYLLQSKESASELVRVTPALRAKVSFHQLNLMDPQYSMREMFDIVFCRNVLIYFDRNTQEAVIRKIVRHIVPGGYLFIGHSESLTGMSLPLEPAMTSAFRVPLRVERERL